MKDIILLIVLALLLLSIPGGFIVGLVITLSGGDGTGLMCSFGLPILVAMMDVAKARKSK